MLFNFRDKTRKTYTKFNLAAAHALSVERKREREREREREKVYAT